MLAERVIAVTGVSSGLGRAMALTFAEAGAKIVGAARRADLGEELAKEITGKGGEMIFEPADLSKVDDCRRFIRTAVDHHGRLDVLINNHAVRTDPPILALHDVDEGNWHRVIDTNLKGAFFCASAAVDVMRNTGGGTVINIASYSGVDATAGAAVYGLSKAGLIQLAKAICVEYADADVRGIAIILGKTATGQAARAAKAMHNVAPETTADPPVVDKVTQAQDPFAVARALALLCTKEAAPFTGAVIALDQGVTAGLYSSRFTYHLLAADRT
jgi:NAD(P)-dependent dehydrogenase (short-subunit alcohol dehydrogenase family)